MKRTRLTYANVVSTIALVASLTGGAAYAASQIGSKDIANNSITARDIAKNAIGQSELKGGPIPGLAGYVGADIENSPSQPLPADGSFVPLDSGSFDFEAKGRTRLTGVIEVTNTTGSPLGLCDHFVVDGEVVADIDVTIPANSTVAVPIATSSIVIFKGKTSYSIEASANAAGLEIDGLHYASDEFRPIVIPPGRG